MKQQLTSLGKFIGLNLDFKPREFILIGIIALVATIIMLLGDQAIHLLRYQHKEVSEGELWRLVTANFTHSGWNHWLLNFTGLVLIDYLFQPVISQSQRTRLLVFCIVLNTVFLHLFMQLSWYVGLSGALHGYLIGGALLSWSKAKMMNTVIVTVVTIKLVAELGWEINRSTAEFIGANVVEEAHLAGSVAALIYALIFYIGQKIKKGA
ncbi:MAG: rhombosortase [Kangiellaceae bacterium]|nr:rhombosortase [Kangiellaceae bacterium]MCW8999279.1 rhombosortase [Kangiellaceae bacterium]